MEIGNYAIVPSRIDRPLSHIFIVVYVLSFLFPQTQMYDTDQHINLKI